MFVGGEVTGPSVGDPVGCDCVGTTDGTAVGALTVGMALGPSVGGVVGVVDGMFVEGTVVGLIVGHDPVGDVDGCGDGGEDGGVVVGCVVGIAVGLEDVGGVDGTPLGCEVGLCVGLDRLGDIVGGGVGRHVPTVFESRHMRPLTIRASCSHAPGLNLVVVKVYISLLGSLVRCAIAVWLGDGSPVSFHRNTLYARIPLSLTAARVASARLVVAAEMAPSCTNSTAC